MRDRIAATLRQAWGGHGALSDALLPASWVFGAAAAVRRAFYAHRLRASSRLPVPVIVVGNVVVGGAGKTPTTFAIVELLRQAGWSPGVVSRGYGRSGTGIVEITEDASAAEVGDEPLLLRRRSGVPVVVGADRVGAGHTLLRGHPGIDAIVSDDGLQHLALERDLEVLVIDERGAGNGRLMPAGPLRERLPRTLRKHQLVLYNADRPTTPLPGYVARRSLAGVVPLDVWWQGAAATLTSLDALRGRPLVAVAGLARPQRFFAMLRAQGLDVVECAPGDHADFTTLPWPPGATDVVVTEKDAVKLPPSRALGTRVWVARLDFAPEPAFEAALLALLPRRPPIDPNGNSTA